MITTFDDSDWRWFSKLVLIGRIIFNLYKMRSFPTNHCITFHTLIMLTTPESGNFTTKKIYSSKRSMHVTVPSSINWRFRSFESPSSKTIALSLSVTQAHIELSTLDRYKNHIYLGIIINVSHKVCKVPVSPGLQDASAHRSQKCTIEKLPLFSRRRRVDRPKLTE